MNRVLLEVQRTPRDTLRICLGESRGQVYVDMRNWHLDESSGKPEATCKGLTVWSQQIADVIAALSVAAQHVAAHGPR
jgi:hypothetical protein